MDTTFKEPIRRTPINAALHQQGVAMRMVGDWQVAGLFGSVDDEVAAAKTAVALADLSAMGRAAVQGVEADAVVKSAFGIDGMAIGDVTVVDDTLICRLRPDMFMFVTVSGGEADVVANLEKASEKVSSLVTVSDITNGRFQYQIVGPQAALLLGRLCGLDLHNSLFPNKHVKQSSVAKIRQTIIRQDIGELPAYHLVGAGSFGQYAWETILEAGENLGIKPMGHTSLKQLIE